MANHVLLSRESTPICVVAVLLGTSGYRNTGGRVRDVSLSESSSDSGDDYREKPKGRGARQTEREQRLGEREGQERDTLGALSIPASCRVCGRREQLHRARQGKLGTVGH